MDVRIPGRSSSQATHVVARPHVPAYFWFGSWALILALMVVLVLRMARWDGSPMMLIPIGLLLAFGVPLYLVIRNLTAVAIVDRDGIELRRFARYAWRLSRQDVIEARPTPGMVEGPLLLLSSTSGDRAIPGFLLRGMRGTWVDDLRHGRLRPRRANPVSARPIETSQSAGRFPVGDKKAAEASIDGHVTMLASMPWQTRVASCVGAALLVANLFFPLDRVLWMLNALFAASTLGIAVVTQVRHNKIVHSDRAVSLVCIGLLPGVFFINQQFDWQTLGPGFARVSLCSGAAILLLTLCSTWRGSPKEKARAVIMSLCAAGGFAYWINGMLSFANMRFDEAAPQSIESAIVLSSGRDATSRYRPPTRTAELGSTPSFDKGLTARFTDGTLPAGKLVAGSQCVLLIRPRLLDVRWVQVAVCH
ncbi:hypothetical protein SAMN02800694_1431 [Luteibacter sp. UNCMF331Sha3.1]|uniref:hypothetical protein n=1 Tax=Luteibacter sp. UNCMF331Sha3.1 TaxID=1502760 RepID=UPI0008C40CC0|nr:hypothetical protein [Luteibacter sp. UNCMF331Sha3.1]SEM53785.1 hypothetical protein SAMN02800694_1431 [Luteibacter sp. UNCMF331Sha3.1]